MPNEVEIILERFNGIILKNTSEILLANRIIIRCTTDINQLVVRDNEVIKKLEDILSLLKDCKATFFKIDTPICYDYKRPINMEALYDWLAVSKVTSIDLSNFSILANEIDMAKNLSSSSKNLFNFSTMLLYIKKTTELSNITSFNLSSNNLYEMDYKEWETLFLQIQNSNITSLNLSNNNLYKMDFYKYRWKVFCLQIKNSNISYIDLSNNNLERVNEESWDMLIDALKQGNIINIDFGQDTIKKLSDKRKQDLVRFLLNKVSILKYQNMTILQFDAVFTSLGCKFKDKNREDSFYKYSMLVTNLLKYLFIQGLNDRLNSNLLDINDFLDIIPSEQQRLLLNTPLSKLNSAHCFLFICCLYEQNNKLQNFRIAHSQYFLLPVVDFLKEVDNDFLNNNDKVVLYRVFNEQQNITTEQLNSVIIIAEQCDKQEILTEVRSIINIRNNIRKKLASFPSNERDISEFIRKVCEDSNLNYEKNKDYIQLKQIISKIMTEDGDLTTIIKKIPEIAHQISINYKRNTLVEVSANTDSKHTREVTEQRRAVTQIDR
jgi:hypothetical protein